MVWVTIGHRAWKPSVALLPLLPSWCSHKDVADQFMCMWKWQSLCTFKIPKRTILIQKQYSLCLIHVLHKCIARMWYYIVCVQKATVFIFEFKLGRSSQNLLSVAMDYINVAVNCIGILVPPDIELLSVPYPVEAAWVRFEWARTLTQATAASLGTWTWLLWASFWPAS